MINFQFKRTQFSEYRENKFLKANGFFEFKNDLIEKKQKEGVIYIYPFGTDEVYTWNITKYFNKFYFKPNHIDFKNRFIDFKNSILYILRNYGVIYINVSLNTGQFHNNKEIKELWAYRMIIIDRYVISENLSSETVYNNMIIKFTNPDSHTVYCGPDGKIFGWDKL